MSLVTLSTRYSEHVYRALLLLYPVRFRMRFAAEMLQLFHDCNRDAVKKGDPAILLDFWMRATRDLLISVFRERGRALTGPIDSEHPLVGIVDLLLIPTIVAANLAVLGPVLTLLFAGARMRMDQFVATSLFFSLAIGTLAVAASVVFTRLRPTVRLWVKLSA